MSPKVNAAALPLTGVVRHTMDLDIFTRSGDCGRALAALSAAGYSTEITDTRWPGKAYSGAHYIDVIFNSGNGVAEVDDAWFEHAIEARLLGLSVRLCPPEETIWSKAFIMERKRYDGADIAHLLRACGERLDWQRLLVRCGLHWRVLLSHQILFGFIYPSERESIPPMVLEALLARLQRENHLPPNVGRLCQGTILSKAQYVIDVEPWGYQDARFPSL